MENEVSSRILNRSSQLTHIQTFVNKLHQRGHLITLYQDIERIMEIEKENNKIESVIKNTKTNWKDCFHLFKTNFIMICQTIIEDLYDSMVK